MRLGGPRDPILLDATLLGGQSFRWTRVGEEYRGVVAGEAWVARPGRARGAIAVEGASSKRAVGRYFRMSDDYAAALDRIAEDAFLAPAVDAYRGLRVLRQEPWEALAAFIASANNNVKRITLIVERLAAAAGERRDGPWGPYHAFPTPRAVADLGEHGLRKVGLGYRAPFLAAAAERVASGRLSLARLRRRGIGEVREALLDVPGVGPKVAECVALFALDKTDAFPVDRWISRVVSIAYHDRKPVKDRDVAAFARERWGADAGLAQQLLFHAARMRKLR